MSDWSWKDKPKQDLTREELLEIVEQLLYAQQQDRELWDRQRATARIFREARGG